MHMLQGNILEQPYYLWFCDKWMQIAKDKNTALLLLLDMQ